MVRRTLGMMALAVALCGTRQANADTVTCSSEDGGRHTCDLGANYGRVRMIRQRSGSPCEEGRTWGTDSRGIWVDRGCRADFDVDRNYSDGGAYDNRRDYDRGSGRRDEQVVTCSSEDGGRHYCNVSPNARVRLGRQRSGSACDEGRTWGVDSRGIWVDRGCRADFIVSQRRGGGYDDRRRDDDRGSDDRQYGTRTVTCSSDDGGRNHCDLGSGDGRVRLLQQRSGSPCEEGRSWGTDDRGIWVDHGCRADFSVERR